jgi:hypothetical protein
LLQIQNGSNNKWCCYYYAIKEKLISVKEGSNSKESNEIDEDKDQLEEEQEAKSNGQETTNQVF